MFRILSIALLFALSANFASASEKPNGFVIYGPTEYVNAVDQSFDANGNNFKAAVTTALYTIRTELLVQMAITSVTNTDDPNFEWAERLLNTAALRGNANAMFKLSCIYLHGFLGRQPNLPIGTFWLMRAVQLKHPTAIFKAGLLFQNGGCGFPVDSAKSDDLIRLAAELGDRSAMALVNGP